jgi:hypothetical protein
MPSTSSQNNPRLENILPESLFSFSAGWRGYAFGGFFYFYGFREGAPGFLS